MNNKSNIKNALASVQDMIVNQDVIINCTERLIIEINKEEDCNYESVNYDIKIDLLNKIIATLGGTV
jgi:hypothetical protein